MSKYEDRLSKGSKVRFGLTAVILIIASVLVLPKYQELQDKKTTIENLESNIRIISTDLEKERDIYRSLKEDYILKAVGDEETITDSLPQTAQQTNIVRELENYMNKIAGDDGVTSLNKITFGRIDQNEESDYLVLPFKMAFSTSEEKLSIILKHLEETGEVNSESGETTRLLDTQEINISVREDAFNTSKKGNINVDLSINAYILPDLEK